MKQGIGAGRIGFKAESRGRISVYLCGDCFNCYLVYCVFLDFGVGGEGPANNTTMATFNVCSSAIGGN